MPPHLIMSWINLGEVPYIVERRAGTEPGIFAVEPVLATAWRILQPLSVAG